MSEQNIVGGGGSACTPLPLPENAIIVNANDSCNSFSTLTAAIAKVNADAVDGAKVYVLSDTSEVTAAVTVDFDTDIIVKDDVTISLTGAATSFAVNSGKTVTLYGGNWLGDGDNVGIWEGFDGLLKVYNTRMKVVGNAGACIYFRAGDDNSVELYNSFFTTDSEDCIELGVFSAIIRNCFIETTSANGGHNPIDASGGFNNFLDFQDNVIRTDTGGSGIFISGANFVGATPALSSKIIRNTIVGDTGFAIDSTSVWSPAYISMNTIYAGSSGGIRPTITVFAGLTNDII